MAKRSGKSKGKGKLPQFSIAFSAKIKEKKYDRGPSFGLWKSDADQVLANGPVKDDEKRNKKGEKVLRLTDLVKFLKKHVKKGHPIYMALFKSDDRGKGGSSSSASSSSSAGATSTEESSSEAASTSE